MPTDSQFERKIAMSKFSSINMPTSSANDDRVAELTAEVRDWQLLHTMSSQLIQSRDLADQLQIVLEVATRLADGDQGLISLFSPEHSCLFTSASRGLSDEALSAIARVEVGYGACGSAFQKRSRVVVADTRTDECYAKYREFARQHGIESVCSTPFFRTDGSVLGVLSTYSTQQKTPSERELRLADVCASQIGLLVSRAEAERELSTERMRAAQVLEAMSDGFVVMDRNFRVVQLNAEALRLDGRAAEEIIGLTHWEAWPGSEDLELGTKYKYAMESRTAVRLEQWYSREDLERCFAIAAHPFSDGLALFYTDVTTQRQGEQAVRDSEQRFHQLANTIPQLAWMADKDGSIFWYNERWYGYTGTSYAEMHGWKWQSVHHPDMLDKVMERWTTSIATGEPFEMTFPLLGSDGVFRPFYTLVSPLRDEAGNITHWFGTNTDISALAEADRRKDEFLAMLAHELRNPLSPISSASHLLALPAISPDQVKHASTIITRQVGHMTELIDDLLDVSRVTRGLITLEKSILDVAQVLNGAIEQVRPLIDSRLQRLSVEMEPNVPRVFGDPTRLIQVFANLINNASKYSPQEATIAISVRSAGNQISLSIRDNGIGISSKLLPHVFELFAQAERTSDRAQGGLGLGLALVKSIVELHGGRATAYSEGLGKGSKFEVVLPAHLGAASTSALNAGEAERSLVGARAITIVDDNVDSAESLASVLRANGHAVTTWHSGKALLALLEQIEPQDIFILDIGLPEMDGYELVRALLKSPKGANSTMVALTGYGQALDKAIGKAAGFHHYFVKPIKFEELASVLAGALPP